MLQRPGRTVAESVKLDKNQGKYLNTYVLFQVAMGSAKIILTLIVLTYALLPVLGAPAEGDPLLCLSLPGSPPCNPSGEGHGAPLVSNNPWRKWCELIVQMDRERTTILQ
ncbi:uncharacterized protein LOC118437214 isoform X3 [Folsomia candida]|uniref:uncharacterized protein LOC118437214 isoform X3 n=1 Tax=Folsomia candida TaxID=158441 RepID=UPI001604A36E|nr:uncharacterized protein LOC118437214 isoform X3 [Folsomia candida]